MKKFLYLAVACLCLVSCYKGPRRAERIRFYYINVFVSNMLNSYYLWSQEVKEKASAWSTKEYQPVEKLKEVRYVDDKWSTLYSDAEAFMSAINGDGRTFGFEPILDVSHARLIVPFVYDGSPAHKAGLKRGDVFTVVNGETLTAENCEEVVRKAFASTTVDLAREDGSALNLTAESRYNNPVNLVKVLNLDGKKIGYLHYTNFTLRSGKDLESAFSTFKNSGIEELVLDLRYNGGGYSLIASALASMLAPMADVSAGKIFSQNVYNEAYTASLRKAGRESVMEDRLALKHDLSEQDAGVIDAGRVNLGLPRLWVITTGNTASASESLIGGLMPYMDVTLAGSRTHGKSYSGSFITAPSFYQALEESSTVWQCRKCHEEYTEEYEKCPTCGGELRERSRADINCEEGMETTENWGLYLIVSKFADCNGNTPALPSGIPADISVADNPLDGYPLGDPSETMLHEVLAQIGVVSKTVTKSPLDTPNLTFPLHTPAYGLNILPLR